MSAAVVLEFDESEYSDDLGLGLPVMGAIFEPAVVKMCFVLAALQTAVFNPIIFMLLGVGMAKRDAPTDGTPPAATSEIVRAVLRSLTKNLIVLSVFFGLAYNAAFGRLRARAPTARDV